MNNKEKIGLLCLPFISAFLFSSPSQSEDSFETDRGNREPAVLSQVLSEDEAVRGQESAAMNEHSTFGAAVEKIPEVTVESQVAETATQ
nr:MetaGeneMark_Unknown Function [uncultured bacterium]